jgi:TatD DNase family protein
MFHDKNHKSASSLVQPVHYIDAHIHLANAEYTDRISQLVEEASRHDVSQVLSNATDYQTSLDTISLAKAFPERVLAAVGVHPFALLQSDNLHLEDFRRVIDENSRWITAIGEIGLDGKYTQDERVKVRQMEIFRFFLSLAEEKNLPVVIHSRQDSLRVIDCLSDFHLPSVLLHWYDGPIENLSLLEARRYMISVGPALLYSRKIAEIARTMDSNLILTETDGPVIYRGLFGNELTKPWFVIEVLNKLADIRGVTGDVMKSAIFSNFQRFLARPR